MAKESYPPDERINSLRLIFQKHTYLAGCVFSHLMIDGFFVILYPLLPLIAQDFNLPLSKVGILRTCFSFSATFLQIPFALLSERLWEMSFLFLGMSWVSVGLLAMGITLSFGQLLLLTFICGIGGNIQHPVASAFISRLYENRSRGSAIGVLNFSGDIGKIIFPLLVSAILLSYSWRSCFIIIGAAGLLFSLLFGWLSRRKHGNSRTKKQKDLLSRGGLGITSPLRFVLLSLIGTIDASTRTVLLTFVPFLLLDKGIQATRIGFLLTLLFIGGALGKLGCGFLADRIGNFKMIILTEILTALSILLFLPIQRGLLIPLLIFCRKMESGTIIKVAIAMVKKIQRRPQASPRNP
ncbi:putative L-galactonate transporter [subsurface metagenome]